MFPVLEFTIGLWIHEKALLKEVQGLKGDLCGIALHGAQTKKQAKKLEQWKWKKKKEVLFIVHEGSFFNEEFLCLVLLSFGNWNLVEPIWN